MQFNTAGGLTHILENLIKQGEDEHRRQGHGERSVDYDLRIAGSDFSEESTPVVLKGSNGTLWITAFNAWGKLPKEVEEDLGMSSGEVEERLGF